MPLGFFIGFQCFTFDSGGPLPVIDCNQWTPRLADAASWDLPRHNLAYPSEVPMITQVSRPKPHPSKAHAKILNKFGPLPGASLRAMSAYGMNDPKIAPYFGVTQSTTAAPSPANPNPERSLQ